MLWNRLKHIRSQEVLLARLRTQAHVLDKSLYTGSWEPGRGKAAYKTCRSLIKSLHEERLLADPSCRWAVGKILEYERAQQDGPPAPIPYKPTCADEDSCLQVLELIKSRRSVRNFLDRPIEPALLATLAEMVNWAPTSCCRQSTFLYIAQDPSLVEASISQCAGASCFDGKAPCFICVCADMRFYDIRDRHLPLIDATFGVQSMLLAAHAYGVEGTILNWMHATRKQERTLRRLLGVPIYQQIVFNLALGYPVNAPPAPGRKGPDLTYSLRSSGFA